MNYTFEKEHVFRIAEKPNVRGKFILIALCFTPAIPIGLFVQPKFILALYLIAWTVFSTIIAGQKLKFKDVKTKISVCVSDDGDSIIFKKKVSNKLFLAKHPLLKKWNEVTILPKELITCTEDTDNFFCITGIASTHVTIDGEIIDKKIDRETVRVPNAIKEEIVKILEPEII